jgi:hypothetical protein
MFAMKKSEEVCQWWRGQIVPFFARIDSGLGRAEPYTLAKHDTLRLECFGAFNHTIQTVNLKLIIEKQSILNCRKMVSIYPHLSAVVCVSFQVKPRTLLHPKTLQHQAESSKTNRH